MAAIVTNIVKIYLNLDRTMKKIIQPFISRGANLTVQIMLVAPFDIQNSQYVNFGLENEIEVPTRYMTLVGTENSVDTNNEDWGVWVYTIGEKILQGAASNNSEELDITFTEFLNSVSPSQYEFIGFQSTEAALNVNFPTPTNDQYAGVGDGTTLGTSICYLAINGTWVNQNKTVLQFESDNDILRESLVGESVIITLGVDPNISTINDEIDNTNLDIIFKNISTLNGKVLSIETLLGVDGDNFVKSALASEYVVTSTPQGNDQMYMEKENGDKRRVSFADLAAGARDNFIGTFATASGLTCPDPDDLICTWPNGIADPNDRLGWVANIIATNSLWRWITASNEWQDTGEAPSLAKDIGYDPTSDPITVETNVQDAMVEHGTKIKAAEDAIDVVEDKTQKFNSSGDIAEDIEVITTKDISSPDLTAATSYAGIIAALIAEYGRNNTQDTNIATNSSDILTKLVKDFSTLVNKSNPDNADLLVLYDGATNKNISYQELVAAIETQIQFYQGYFVDKAALDLAIPIGQAGWYATLGDVDTQAVWDVEGAGWIEVASKLYYTKTSGTALELRVTNAEGSITTINATLLTKEDLTNKLSSKSGNEGSTQFYLSIAGIEEYVEPIRIQNEEDRTQVLFSQQVASTKFQTLLNDTTLYEGRKLFGRIESITVQAGVVQISIDGGLTFKNLAATQIVAGNPIYVDFDLTINNVFGRYIEVIYYEAIEKWVVYATNENLARIVGIGWTLDVTLMGEKLRIDDLTTRIDNLEENQGVTALQEVAINTPVVVVANTIAHELVFDEATIPSNETEILDVDGNFNHVIKVNTEPGISFDFYTQIKNQGTPGSDATAVYYVANKSAPVTAGSFEIGKKYIINAVGTTDFTAIGASANTIGIVFIATGVGTGTGSALFVFRDISVTAIGQDVINDRGIPFSISNDDYLAPFTPGIYYVKEGVNFNILQTILTCKTLFPSGAAAASDETTVLTDITTKTPSGVKTIQADANKEYTILHKDHTESDKVVVAAYQSAGQYMANKTDIILDTNKIVRVLFSGEGTDLTELVELSLDNGGNYYDVEYRETDVDLTVKNVVTHVMDLYFTGIKFIATYVDSVIENQDLPYVGLQGQFEIPKNGVPIHIGEEITEKPKGYKGGTLNQQLNDGNIETSFTSDDSNSAVNVKSDGTLEVRTSYDATGYNFSLISGRVYFVICKIKSTSIGRIQGTVRFKYSDETTTSIFDGTEGLIASGILTADKSLDANFKIFEGAPGLVERDYQMVIDITDSYLNGLTADQIDDMITYIDGQQSVGSPVELNQLLDNRNDLAEFTLNGTPTVVDINETDKMFEFEGASQYVEQTGILAVSTQYTILTWVDESSYATSKFYIMANSQGNNGDIYLPANFKGISKDLYTTGAAATVTYRYGTSGTSSATAKAKVRIIILEGDWTHLSDEKALKLIQEQEFGTFEIGGVFINSVGKNKTDMDSVVLGRLGASGEIIDSVFVEINDIEKNIGKIDFDVLGVFRGVTFKSEVKANANYNLSLTRITGSAYSRRISYYDINDNFISHIDNLVTDIDITFLTPANTYFIRYDIASPDVENVVIEDLQLELGSSATDHEDFIEANAHIDGELGDLPNGVTNDLEFEKLIKHTLVAEDITSLLTTDVNVDVVLIAKPENSKGKGSTTFNTEEWFTINSFNYLSGGFQDDAAFEEYVYESNPNSIGYIVEIEKYANLTEARADLVGKILQYELTTYLPRNEINNNVIPVSGNLITGPGYTYIQKSSSGITNEFKATTAVNTKSQTKLNTDAIVDIFKILLATNGDLDRVIELLNKAIDEIGYLPDLTTTNKDDLVAALNELVTNIGSLASLTTTDKSNLVAAINEVVANLDTNHYTKTEIDNLFTALLSGLDWKETVATFADIATTYPSPDDGWTVNVEDTDLTYRYDGATWIKISSNSIPLATESVDGIMAQGDKEKINHISVSEAINLDNVAEFVVLVASGGTIPIDTAAGDGLDIDLGIDSTEYQTYDKLIIELTDSTNSKYYIIEAEINTGFNNFYEVLYSFTTTEDIKYRFRLRVRLTTPTVLLEALNGAKLTTAYSTGIGTPATNADFAIGRIIAVKY